LLIKVGQEFIGILIAKGQAELKKIVMNTKIKFSLVALSVFFCSQSFGQTARPSLSIGAELGIPTGDLNASQKIGIGGSVKAAFPVTSDLDITASVGIISFSGDEVGTVKNPALNFIPIKAGVRYRFVPHGFYLEPQLGYTSINTPNSNGSATGGFTYAANAGYFLTPNLDLSARYEGVSKKGSQGNLAHVGLRLAYNFSL